MYSWLVPNLYQQLKTRVLNSLDEQWLREGLCIIKFSPNQSVAPVQQVALNRGLRCQGGNSKCGNVF